jgi:hypothetical protein
MIRKQTLFVIGAGASCELNLPLGPTLKENIVQALASMSEESLQKSRLRRALAMHVSQRDGDLRGLNDLVNKAAMVARQLPGASSIDSYVENKSDDKDVAVLAKLAIAEVLHEAECKSKVLR